MGDKYLTKVALSTLTDDDQEYIIELARKGRLNWSPRKNWVENSGGLPPYIEEVAIGIMKSGKSREAAIAIAVSRIRKWARGGDGVDPDTITKSIAALAQWEALRAKNRLRTAAKKARKKG